MKAISSIIKTRKSQLSFIQFQILLQKYRNQIDHVTELEEICIQITSINKSILIMSALIYSIEILKIDSQTSTNQQKSKRNMQSKLKKNFNFITVAELLFANNFCINFHKIYFPPQYLQINLLQSSSVDLMMICFLFFVFHSSYLLQAREHAFFFSNLQRGSNQNLEIFKTQEIKAESKAWHRQINPEHPNKQIGRQRLLQNSISLCGNNVIETLEECDDGNMVSGDGCSISCTYQCGDGNLNSLLQQCDDGNRVSGDGCSSTCKTENMNPRSALIIGASIVTIFLASLLIAIQWLSKKKAQKSSKSEKEVQRINKVQIQCETKIKMAIYSQSHSHCRMMVS